jgi:hypothetical protein
MVCITNWAVFCMTLWLKKIHNRHQHNLFRSGNFPLTNFPLTLWLGLSPFRKKKGNFPLTNSNRKVTHTKNKENIPEQEIDELK